MAPRHPFYGVDRKNEAWVGGSQEAVRRFAATHPKPHLTVMSASQADDEGVWLSNVKGLRGASRKKRSLGSAPYADSVEQYKRGTNAAKAMTAAYNGNCVEAKKLIKKALHEPKKTPLKVYAAAYKIVAGRCGLPMRGARSRRRSR